MTRLCSKCGDPHDRKRQRYCASCHAAHMREWRKKQRVHADTRETSAFRALVAKYVRAA
jgi:hypothetical protein